MKNLQQLRRELDVSQEELALNMGVTQPQISKIESGANDLRLTTLVRYVEALGCELTLQITVPTVNNEVFALELPRYCYELHCAGVAREHLYGSPGCSWELVNGDASPVTHP